MTDPSTETRSDEAFQPREIFLGWEKLRIVYNAILIPFVVAVTWLLSIDLVIQPRFWWSMAYGGVVANVCYFAGPVFETYLTWLGIKLGRLRAIVFLLGLAFTMILALAAIDLWGWTDEEMD